VAGCRSKSSLPLQVSKGIQWVGLWFRDRVCEVLGFIGVERERREGKEEEGKGRRIIQ
jgi:hypothetical protein